MYPSQCKSVRASSLVEATELMEEYGPTAHVLAGGQSLVPLMKQRLAHPDVLIDISHIDPTPIEVGNDEVVVHALTKHATVGSHETITNTFDVIADAVPQIGDPQVRNMGTVGGALAEADPGNDWGLLLIATDGQITAIGPDGEKTVPATEFYDGPFTTKLEHGELIREITLPLPPQRTGGAYIKAKRRQGGYGTAAIGIQLTLDEDDTCSSIAIAGVDDASAYVIPEAVIELVTGRKLTDDLVEESATLMADAVNPISDNLGSSEYKRNLMKSIYNRGVKTAYCRALGQEITDSKNISGHWGEVDV